MKTYKKRKYKKRSRKRGGASLNEFHYVVFETEGSYRVSHPEIHIIITKNQGNLSLYLFKNRDTMKGSTKYKNLATCVLLALLKHLVSDERLLITEDIHVTPTPLINSHTTDELSGFYRKLGFTQDGIFGSLFGKIGTIISTIEGLGRCRQYNITLTDSTNGNVPFESQTVTNTQATEEYHSNNESNSQKSKKSKKRRVNNESNSSLLYNDSLNRE